ncbi:MAG: GspE/PulE family protein [Myxococcota bacterium]
MRSLARALAHPHSQLPSSGQRRGLEPRQAALALLRRSESVSPTELEALGIQSLEQLTQMVADQLLLARMELDEVELDGELAKLVPRATAERHRLVPVYATSGELTIATCDPSRLEIFDWLGRELGRSILVVVSSAPEVTRAIQRLYDAGAVVAATTVTEADPSPEDLAEACQAVDAIIFRAVDHKASDIHLEPNEKQTVVRYRIDGALRHMDTRPIELHAALVSRIKVMAHLDISEHQIPQDGRIKIRRQNRVIDLRVSVLPTYFGEKVCCRILDNSRASLPLSELGFEREQLASFERMIRSPYGLLLVTGPTGSGKSTTLYGALNAVRSPELNIVTVEDPVEYQLPGINQVQINPKRGLTFAGALRSILRQDPNVVLVGEIRDHETGTIAAEAALTGHLVMASLHTNDAPSAVTRLTEMGIEPYLLAPALVGVIAQRLLRKCCASCARHYDPKPEELEALGIVALPSGVQLVRGAGCSACHGTGYSGRVAVRELLEVTDSLKASIGRGTTADELRKEALAAGFRTMRLEALKKLLAGVTSAEEVIRVTRG